MGTNGTRVLDARQLQHSSESGLVIGVLIMCIVLIAAIVGALAVSNISSANTSNLERARTDASGFITQAEILQKAMERYSATGGDLENINTISSLQAAGILPSSFHRPRAGETASDWEIHQMSFAIGPYTQDRYVMIQVKNVAPDICAQINSILTQDSTMITFGNSSTTGIVGANAQQEQKVATMNRGCRNYTAGGPMAQNVYIHFVPKL